jgi:hypothetical protein
MFVCFPDRPLMLLLTRSAESVFYLFRGTIFASFRPMNCGDKWPTQLKDFSGTPSKM